LFKRKIGAAHSDLYPLRSEPRRRLHTARGVISLLGFALSGLLGIWLL
jgi:hypothetical protein